MMDEKEQPKKPKLTQRNWETHVDEAIREAMEQGKFENLSGKGKPQNLNRNPYHDESWDAAYRMLHGAGFAPDWIEEEKELRQDEENARDQLQRSWAWYQDNLARARSDAERQRLAGHWQRAQEIFRQRAAELNRRIDIFNLKVPVLTRQRFRMRPDEVIARVTAQTPGTETR